jgi:hypothetical protein
MSTPGRRKRPAALHPKLVAVRRLIVALASVVGSLIESEQDYHHERRRRT